MAFRAVPSVAPLLLVLLGFTPTRSRACRLPADIVALRRHRGLSRLGPDERELVAALRRQLDRLSEIPHPRGM